METRLTTGLWVAAHVRTCFLADMPAFVVAKGDDARGGVILKINRFAAGVLLLEQSRDFDGGKIWRILGAPEGTDEAEADSRIAKKRGFDPDLWVIEIEDARGQYQPDAPISAL